MKRMPAFSWLSVKFWCCLSSFGDVHRFQYMHGVRDLDDFACKRAPADRGPTQVPRVFSCLHVLHLRSHRSVVVGVSTCAHDDCRPATPNSWLAG